MSRNQLSRARGLLGVLAGTAASLLAASSAQAYLGGFESGDGYGGFLNEVRGYNAGQYGLNNGGPGGGPMAIAPNSGLWYGISGTMFPTFFSGNTSYATGHENNDRLAPSTPAQALIVTTNCEGWGGTTLKYGYRVDSRDLDGVSPAATAGQVVNISFWTRAVIDANVAPGYIGDTVEFVDSGGNVGFAIGVERGGTNTVTFRNSGSYTPTLITAFGVYSRWDISLDLGAQTVTASYFDGGTSTLFPILTGAPLAATMGNLDQLYFASTPGVTNAKEWALDDFDFRTNIPAPGTLASLLPAVGLLLRRRRN